MQFGTLRGGIEILTSPARRGVRTGVIAFVLDRLPHTRICRVVITAYFTKRLPAKPCATVSTNCRSARNEGREADRPLFVRSD